jgi:hypothetical protein
LALNNNHSLKELSHAELALNNNHSLKELSHAELALNNNHSLKELAHYSIYINVIENRRSNQRLTIEKHKQHLTQEAESKTKQ